MFTTRPLDSLIHHRVELLIYPRYHGEEVHDYFSVSSEKESTTSSSNYNVVVETT